MKNNEIIKIIDCKINSFKEEIQNIKTDKILKFKMSEEEILKKLRNLESQINTLNELKFTITSKE